MTKKKGILLHVGGGMLAAGMLALAYFVDPGRNLPLGIGVTIMVALALIVGYFANRRTSDQRNRIAVKNWGRVDGSDTQADGLIEQARARR